MSAYRQQYKPVERSLVRYFCRSNKIPFARSSIVPHNILDYAVGALVHLKTFTKDGRVQLMRLVTFGASAWSRTAWEIRRHAGSYQELSQWPSKDWFCLICSSGGISFTQWTRFLTWRGWDDMRTVAEGWDRAGHRGHCHPYRKYNQSAQPAQGFHVAHLHPPSFVGILVNLAKYFFHRHHVS